MFLFILGAGYTGLRLAREARVRGWRVCATSRKEQTLDELAHLGATPVRFDVLEDDPAALAGHLGEGAWVVYSAPTLFREHEPAPPGELARHVRPVARVLDAARDARAAGFIYLSSTSVYGDHGGAWIAEDAARRPTSPMGKMRDDIERHVLGREGELAHLFVARIVGIYGPGRTLDRYIQGGRYRLVDGGQKLTNRVHVDDIVTALLAIIARGPEGARAYNVTDGRPRRVVELVDFVCEHLDIARPEEVSLEAYAAQRGPNAAARWQNTYRVSHDRLRDELGWSPRHEDVLEGYRAIFGDEE